MNRSKIVRGLLTIGCLIFSLQTKMPVKAEWDSMNTLKPQLPLTEVSAPEVVKAGDLIVSTEYPDYTYNIISDTQIQLYEYTGNETVVVIPERIDGYEVVKLGPVFDCNTTVKEVTVPGTVKRTQGTFFYASALETVHLQEGIEEIGGHTFYECTGLKSVNLPEGLISIEVGAFENCRSLTEIVFPDTLQHFGTTGTDYGWEYDSGVFYNCDSLTSVTIPKSVTDYFAAMSDEELCNHNGPNLFYGCDNLTEIIFEDSKLTTIPTGMFAGLSKLQNYTVPSTVTRIGNYAFVGCKNLTQLTIPDSVRWIGDGAFVGCKKLTEVTLPDSVTFMGIEVFYECIALEDVTLSKELTSIPDFTFEYCESLERIELPAKVERIYQYAFADCTELVEIVWPDNLRSIARGSFDGTALASVDIPDTVTHILAGAFGNCRNLEEVTLPENLEYLGQGCFQFIKGLKTLEIPNTLIDCEDQALFYADIETLYFEEGTSRVLSGIGGRSYVQKVVLPESVRVIEETAFWECGTLEEITGTENVTTIEDWAFERCTSLRGIYLPKVEHIGEGAFGDASALTYVDFTGNTVLTTIEDGAFLDCVSLKTFFMPDSVTRLGIGVFEDCGYLQGIHLSANLSEIPEKTFNRCSSLEEVACSEQVVAVGSQAFADCVKLEKLSVTNEFCDMASDAVQNTVDLTIYGLAGSSAESYAEENGIPFVAWVPATNLQLSTTALTVEEGSSAVLNGSALPNNTNDTVRYYSMNGSVASVDAEGNVTGVAPGTTQILVTAGLKYAFCECTVTEKSFEIQPGEVQLRVGENVQLTVEDAVVTYASADEQIAKVGANGQVTALKEGKTTITATDERGKTDSCTVWVVGNVAIPQASEEDFTYTLLEDGTASVTGYTGSLTTFEIPDTLDGYTVSAIGEEAFYERTEIVRIVFPSTITQIGIRAFEGCTGMEELRLPIHVRFLDKQAFEDCDGLTEVMIPSTLDTYRGSTQGVFHNCDNLTKVTFEEGSTVVVSYLVSDCPRLKEIVFPDSVVKIGGSSFTNCDAITEVKLPPNLIGIGGCAFLDCDGLTSIHIPKSLDYCSVPRDEQGGGLVFFTVDKTIVGAFAECENLKTVTFEEGITKIPTYLFEQCPGIEEIVIPDTVSVIEAAAFAQCTNLKSVELPDSVTYIQDCAFVQTALESLDLPCNLYALDLFAFRECNNLTEVTIPKSLKKSYKAMEVDDDPELEGKEQCGSFSGCANLKKAVFEEGMTLVPAHLFAGCSGLEEVVLPDSILEIGDKAFSSCDKIVSLDLPDQLQRIGEKALFYTSIVSLVIPDTVTVLGDYCFENCKALEHIELPEGITAIPKNCFRYCSSLKELEIPASVVDIYSYAFADTGFEEFDVPEGIVGMHGAVFAHCENLERVSISDSVRFIGDSNLFVDCVNLKEVALGKGVTYIPNATFSGCASLERIVLPESVEGIGDRAFEYCTALTEVVMPAGMTLIEVQAFQGCTALEEMVFPRGLREIAYYAFRGCTNLKEVTIPRETYVIDANAFDNPGELTIYGVAGTYAQTYANQVEATFVDLSVPATSVSLNEEALDLFVGGVKTLTATVAPLDCTDVISWGSSNNHVASVSDNGEITAHNVGTVTITVEVGNLQASCRVTVTQPVTSLCFQDEEVTVVVGGSVGNFVYLLPQNATNKELEYSSADTSVATLDVNGTIWGVGVGSTTITVRATDGSGVSASCRVTVTEEEPDNPNPDNPDPDEPKDDVVDIFDDIQRTDWWYSAVQYAYDNNIMSGMEELFKPADELSREQFVRVLYNNSGKPEVTIANKFPDVEDLWYKNAVLWANENGIANGKGDGSFGIGENIMREDLALMLYKYAKLNGYDLAATEGLINQYADGADVSKYAQEALNWAVTQGIMSGKGEKGEDISTFRLDPQGTATRAECASMMKKLLEKNR